MTKNFKKLAVAGAVSTALGMGGLAHASMEGVVGEAFLIPLVTYGVNTAGLLDTNTIISVYAPGIVGQDTIPNDYTARNTTNGGAYTHPTGTVGTGYHWFYFDPRSVHIFDAGSTLTANDLDIVDWATTAGTLGLAPGGVGYMIIANDGARQGDAATMAMVVEASLLLNITGAQEAIRIPTYAMSDGVDGTAPRIGDECVYDSRIPTCSPLISGIRFNNGDGNPNKDAIFQLYVNRDRNVDGTADAEDLHVIWFDRNDDVGRANVPVDVFDDTELQCSSTYQLPNELNLIHIFETAPGAGTFQSLNLTQATAVNRPFCNPGGFFGPGFVQVNLGEVGDAGGGVDAAGAAFDINTFGNFNTADGVAVATSGIFSGGADYVARLAHDLGKQ